MNIEGKLVDLQREANTLNEKVHKLNELYAECQHFTENFLECCEKHDIELVAINTLCKDIESCRNWPFDANNSVFADGKDEEYRPSIWEVVESCKIAGPCGNTGQHSIINTAKLIDGIYEYKDGKWTRR